ncbi:helix-turn-helix domain-containing protein [Rhizobium tubonense]|uniref:HTH cro/C1-type domain-containing protein n=1 Tax=Rhizobium tubonense TaxID=484088 RepID=A0A2W4C1P0_9HYPH|nr:helix-turn-helix domain-containing protein [Rhizobium tubonense]PZM07602.1 hypothetical protein CPY51_31225 [Rhizobium tubonense]
MSHIEKDEAKRVNISQYIVKARRKLKMSQKDLAEALGVSQGSVSKWEAGKESPRAETVERIKVLSGVAQPEENDALSEAADNSLEARRFSHFYEVPLRGRLMDGLPYEPFNASDPRTLMLYLDGRFAESRLEAWIVEGKYPDLPRSFIGVFELEVSGRILETRTQVGRHHRVLTRTVARDETVRMSIEEIHGSPRRGWWLWPLDRQTKDSNLPVLLTEDGVSPEGGITLEGILVAVMYEPSTAPARSLF